MTSRRVVDMATVRDPHHDGDCEWGYDPSSQTLYHRQRPQVTSKWIKVKRINFTPKRVLAIAEGGKSMTKGIAVFSIQSFADFDPDAEHLWLNVRVLDTEGKELGHHRDLGGSHDSLRQVSNTMQEHFPDMIWVSNIVWLTESLQSVLGMQINQLHFSKESNP